MVQHLFFTLKCSQTLLQSLYWCRLSHEWMWICIINIQQQKLLLRYDFSFFSDNVPSWWQEMDIESLEAANQSLQADLKLAFKRIGDLQAAIEDEMESDDNEDLINRYTCWTPQSWIKECDTTERYIYERHHTIFLLNQPCVQLDWRSIRPSKLKSK